MGYKNKVVTDIFYWEDAKEEEHHIEFTAEFISEMYGEDADGNRGRKVSYANLLDIDYPDNCTENEIREIDSLIDVHIDTLEIEEY